MWQCKFLSKASKSQLIKYVLNNLPLYFLSIFRIPNGVAKQIISLQTMFFWSSNIQKKKKTPCSCEVVRDGDAKRNGGLGIWEHQIQKLRITMKMVVEIFL